MNFLLTIIIPVHNCKKYLNTCINSIIDQCDNCIEILLIDDGSSDGSELLCDNYARKYSFIQVVHTENKGVSHARNVGLDMVTTEWVMFADADDAFFDGTFKRIIELANTYNSSIFFGNDRGVEFYDNHVDCAKDIQETYSASTVFSFLTNPAENAPLIKQFDSVLFESCWGKVLNYNFIRDQHIRFNEKLQISEDAIFIIQYLENLEKDDKIILLNNKMYFYRQNYESVTYKLKAFEYMEKRYQVTQEILRLASEEVDEKIKDELEMFALKNFLLAFGSATGGKQNKTYSKFRTYLLNDNIRKMIENGVGRTLSINRMANTYYRSIVWLWDKKMYQLSIWYFNLIYILKQIKTKLFKL